MALVVGDEVYIRGGPNTDGAVRLLIEADTGAAGLPNVSLQMRVNGAWKDTELDTGGGGGGGGGGGAGSSADLTDSVVGPFQVDTNTSFKARLDADDTELGLFDGRISDAEASVAANDAALDNKLGPSDLFQFGAGTPTATGASPHYPGDVYEDRSTTPYTIYDAGDPTVAAPLGAPFVARVAVANSAQGEALVVASGSPVNARINLAATAQKVAAYTAVAFDLVFTNTSGGTFTVTLPASAPNGTIVAVCDDARQWGTNPLTVGRAGYTIQGAAADDSLTTPGLVLYVSRSSNWSRCFIPFGAPLLVANNLSEIATAGAAALTAARGNLVVDIVQAERRIPTPVASTKTLVMSNYVFGTVLGVDYECDTGTVSFKLQIADDNGANAVDVTGLTSLTAGTTLLRTAATALNTMLKTGTTKRRLQAVIASVSGSPTAFRLSAWGTRS